MTRFFTEVPHGPGELECARAVQYFLRTGSHFMIRADWGCQDGVRKAFIVAEAENREEALGLVPALFRPQARVVMPNKFTMEEMDEVIRRDSQNK